MVSILPLNGLTYNKDKVKDFSSVITPPNDVISKQQKQDLKLKSHYNFVNLILPDENGNKYQNAANILDKWEQENIFTKDNEKTIYVYAQTYAANGNTFRRIGFISLLKLEEWGQGVLPHEKVLEKDLQDRISLISTTKANFGVPFLLYDDKKKEIDQILEGQIKNKEPYIDFKDDASVEHTIWKVTNKDFIEKITNEMKKYQCIMADGHHRYTSELKVKEILNIEGSNYGLMCFVNSFNEGMIILPTNRVVFGLDNINMDDFLEKLKPYFEIEEGKDIHELVDRVENTQVLIDKEINLKNHVFAIYSNINSKGYFLKLKDNNVLDSILPNSTDIYKKLDINILHKIIIEGILGITEEQQKNREHIDFIKGKEETIEALKEDKIQLAFFVNSPLMREVFLIARSGETTPQKTTCFYPKVHSGLVIYKMEEE